MTYSPTIRRKRLSAALRQLRRDAGMSAEQVARTLGWDPSKISRIESNDWKLPRVADIEHLAGLYGADTGTRQALVTLARQARQRGWWEQYRDVLGDALPGLEAEATRILNYQPLLVPGLLQTADYKRAICRAVSMDDAETERRVQARSARQRILDRDNPPILWAVIDEAALRKPVGGPQVMADQLHHLIGMSWRDTIRIQVLPDAVGAHAGMGGPIVIMDYAVDPSIVYVETDADGDLFLETAAEVSRFVVKFGHVMASAASVEDSREYLQQWLERLKGE